MDRATGELGPVAATSTAGENIDSMYEPVDASRDYILFWQSNEELIERTAQFYRSSIIAEQTSIENPMITLERIKSRKAVPNYKLRIGNEVFKSGRAPVRDKNRLSVFVSKSLEIEVDVRDDELIERIIEHRFNEIPEKLNLLLINSRYFNLVADLIEPLTFFYIERVDEGFRVYLSLRANTENWLATFTSVEFIVEFYKRLRTLYPTEFENDESYITISPLVTDLDLTIKSELIAIESRLQTIYDQTTESVTAAQKESVAVHFDFPESIRVPCEQYLLYFAQFLKDLGVEADTTLSHEAGQVLFTVTPADQEEALDKIQTALDVYLKLPTNPITDSGVKESIEVQRLEANVLRLRSDLKLAAAEIQAKNTTIRAQNLIIEVQKEMLSGEILASSVKGVTPTPEDKEDVIPGILALSTYEDKGMSINLGEILRRLKRFFSND